MRRIFLFASLCLVSNLFFAQQVADNSIQGVIVASQFGITRPLSEIFAENPVDESKMGKPKKLYESKDRLNRKAQTFEFSQEDGPEYGNDEKSMQRYGGLTKEGQNKVNWAGQTASGFRPYDPSGAAGPNHYVQMINSTTFKVYDKTSGTVLLTATLGNLWTPATANAGDPIVMYDKAADRWFLAQFGSGNQIYIAISTTANPTGSYYTYTYVSPAFPDYLKFSTWADGYYMTSNQSPQKVFAFERAAMLIGTPTAKSVYTNFSPPTGGGFFCPLPADAGDGTLPAIGTPCPIMSYSDNAWGGGNIDAIQMYNMAVNWVPAVPTATITFVSAVPTAAFDASYESSWNNCVQPGTTQKLDAIGGVLMYRAQWKSWPTHNSMVLNWSVNITTGVQRSIKWAELRQDLGTGVWSVYQDGIYTPDASTRWMGSIAMDNNGSIGLSYIKSDATSIFPGLYWTGRRTCDPLGTLPLTETLIVAGTGFQTGTNRVGDYAHTCLDPDGVTFWSTSEYFGGTSGSSVARTQIFSYTINPCGTDAAVTIAVTSGSNPTCAGSSMTFTALPVNGGTTPAYQWQVNGSNVGTNSSTYSSSSLANGQLVTCIMTSNLPGVTANPATSNSIAIVVSPAVTPSVSIALTSGSNPTCAGTTLTFTATPVNGGTIPSYQWQVNGSNAGTNSATFNTSTLSNGQVVTCILTTNALCPTTPTATSNGITVTVNAATPPSVTISQTAGSNPSCAGSSVTFTATVVNGNSPTYQWKVNGGNVGTNSPTYTTSSLTSGQVVTCQVTSTAACSNIVTLGTGTALNATTSGLAACYPTYYGNGRQQYLILASELTSLGLVAGNISSLGFTINGTVGDPSTMNGYTIKMGATGSTVMTTTFLSAPTTVFGPVNYTPTLNALNTHNFTSPFVWDGLTNIVVDICFSNQVFGNAAYQCYRSTSTFVSTTYYQQDLAPGAGACTQATGGATGSIRPNMVISSNAGATNATSNGITMTVNPNVTPAVVIALTSGTNPSCAGSSLTFTATPTNGGATPAYQWKVNGGNVGTNSPSFTTSALINGQAVTCVLTSNAACASPITATSNSITQGITSTVIPAVAIALTTGTNPSCAGSSLTFTAAPTNGGATPAYQWKVNGGNVGANSPTFTTSALTNGQAVTCVMTSNAACASPTTATSNSITVTVNTPNTYYQDNDSDNYGNPSVTQSSCSPVAGYVLVSGDCNDANAAVNPGATENLCNNIDDNCNGTTDEGRVNGCTNASACNYNVAATCDNGSCTFAITWYLDADGDTYYVNTQSSCTSPGLGWTSTLPLGGNSDCNDSNAAVNAGATEVLNGIDDDCDGNIDEGFGAGPVAEFTVTPSTSICAGQSLDFEDLSSGTPISWSWTFSGGAPSSSTDQNPSVDYLSAGTYTVILTVTNAFSNDTETKVNYITVGSPTTWYQDLDGDNYGNNAVTAFICAAPVGYIATGGDCNDGNAAINPGAIENLCNNIDDNCNGTTDEGRVNGCTNASACNYNAAATCDNGSCTFGISWYLDADTDTYYAATQVACASPGAGWTSTLPIGGGGDCNDANAAVNPASSEVCGNGIDDDCDGSVDENCCDPLGTIGAISGPIGACRNQTGVVFSVAPVSGATSYQWTLPTGVSGTSSTNSISLSFSSTYNTGNLCVKALNACAETAQPCATIAVLLAVPATPGDISGGNTNACANTSKVYSITPVSNATSYLWTAPTNATITAGQGTSSVTVTYAANFGSSGVLSVRAVNCKGNSGLKTLIVYGLPGLPGTISGPVSAVCGGTSHSYSILAVNGATGYNWTVPAGAVINSGQNTTAINVTFPVAFSSGAVSVTANSACGTSSVRSVTVYAGPTLPASVTGTTTNLCGGGSFVYTIPAVTGATSYNWTPPAGCTITANTGTSITLSIPANFVSGILCYTITNACGTSPMRCNVLSSVPLAPATINGPASVCPSATGLSYSTPQVLAFTYTWTVPAGCTIVSGQGTNTVSVNWGTTAGSVLVKANNACGSSANRTYAVSLLACMPEQEEGDHLDIGRDNRLDVYPNPSSGTFTIRSPFAGDFVIENELGQMVRQLRLNESNGYKAEVTGLTTGLYFIVGSNNGEVVHQKILVAY